MQRMADPARSAASPAKWDLRKASQAVMRAAEMCADLTPADLRALSAGLRGLVLDDGIVEQERARAAEEALAAAGLVPPPRGRHLRAV
jgi:hypothetical protein